MAKDEAWKAHVEEYDRDRFDSTSRHRRHCFDAGWEAALADTLGMLEGLAKRYGFAQTFIAKWDYLQVHWAGANFLYSGEDGEPEISRDDALALLAQPEGLPPVLLAGEEKTECP